MNLYRDAFENLKRNYGPVLVYVTASAVASFAHVSIATWLFGPELKSETPLFRVVSPIVLAALGGVLCAVCFARIGKDIDRPLWKCTGDGDALQRFFTPWFILFLLSGTVLSLLDRFAEAERGDAATLCFSLYLLLFVLQIPVGTCVMYMGGLHWPLLWESLRPITVLLPLALGVFAITALEFITTVLASQFHGGALYWAAMNAGLSFLECFAFALMWRICMLHRDLPAEQDPDDFGF